ncbi:hypothetical protein C6P46_004657 [Rhodotorula mucilaginosa]|uniref:VWFA domain-containing protein n=1 Tax=Rhodotorula mucilaginosa TaxID=5537 RepID=A0A9P6W1V5_RHOMI|nr:hypothetical protein C6P46_004657 [Rhodotorula mucilaginosa]
MSSRRFIVDDDESLSDEPGTAARREHDPEDESDLDGDLTSDDDNAVSRRLKRNAANRRHGPVKTRSSTTAAAAAAAKAKTAAGRGKAWEGQFERTWDQVQEDEHGTLEGAVSDLLLSYKSRRVLRDSASIQRGIIRHVYLVIDLSSAMLVRDYKATWLDLTLQYAQEFVTEFFDQNPIGQMAIMVTRDGLAERLTPLSGNPADHLKVLQNKKKLEPRGQPSLQNVLQLAKTGLSHLPPHGSREVIIILGSLTTCDPTNIHDTISQVEQERIRVNIIGLSADVKICRDICDHTRGVYRVARDDLAFRDLLFEFVSPPPTIAATASSRSHLLGGASTSSSSAAAADLMQMGFPALLTTTYPGDWPFFGSSVLFQLHIPLLFFHHHHRQPTSNNNHELFLRSVPLGTVRVPEVRAPLLPRVRQGRARGARVLSRLHLYLFSLYLLKGEGEGVVGLFEWDNGVATPDDEATKDDLGRVHSVTEKGGRGPPRRVLQ